MKLGLRIATIKRCRIERRDNGNEAIFILSFNGIDHQFGFYVEHASQRVQEAGVAALDRLRSICKIDNLESLQSFDGATTSIELLEGFEENPRFGAAMCHGRMPLKDRIRTAGYVYVISCIGYDAPLCKIGRAAKPDIRLSSLSTSSPFPLRLDAAIPTPNAAASELAAHTFFAKERTNREWFAINSQDAITFIEGASAEAFAWYGESSSTPFSRSDAA